MARTRSARWSRILPVFLALGILGACQPGQVDNDVEPDTIMQPDTVGGSS